MKNGEIRKTEAIGNVLAVYYLEEDKDSSLTNMAYIETDTMRMFMRNRQLENSLDMQESECYVSYHTDTRGKV